MILVGVMMVFGLKLPFIRADVFNGIWLIFIGLFLNNAAAVSYRQAVEEEGLAAVPVRNVMQTKVPVIASDASLGELLRGNLAKPDGHTMFVMEGQEIVGMVVMKDVKKSLADHHQWSTTTVGEIMIPVSDLLYVGADEDITDALERLQRLDLRHIPVMLNNRIVGLLHQQDVHRLLQLNSELGS